MEPSLQSLTAKRHSAPRSIACGGVPGGEASAAVLQGRPGFPGFEGSQFDAGLYSCSYRSETLTMTLLVLATT